MKNPLRAQMRKTLTAIVPTDAARRSAAACRLLCESPEYRRSEVIMLFLSMVGEIDTAPLALHAWTDGKRVLAPQVSWEQHRLAPIEIRSLNSADIAMDAMGIRQPIAGAQLPVASVDLVIVPGLAFDRAGNRLGRGRGFYDRFLSRPDFRGVSCALAFQEQLLDTIPHDPHDVRMSMIVTDSEVLRIPLNQST